MTALALAVAAALLAAGAAAATLRQFRPAASCVAVGLALMLLVAGRTLDATAASIALAGATVPLIPALAAWGARPPTGRVRFALGAAVLAGPVATVLYDPFLDPGCAGDCRPSPLALTHLGGLPHDLLTLGAAAAAVALTVDLLVGLRRAGAARPDASAAACAAAAAWWVLGPPSVDLPAAALAGGALTATVAVRCVRDWESRTRLTALLRELEGAGDVEATLRAVLGDPTLRVAFWLDEAAQLVTADGGPAPDPSPEQRSTEVCSGGRLVARVDHDPRAVAVPALATAIDGPARLALSNGQLAARLSAEARELRASRVRVVRHADDERRRMERDLHDGAQQHVLALGMALTDELERAGADSARGAVLAESINGTRQVLDELRVLAHGLYPAGLQSAGLGQALDALVDRAPAPVTVVAVPEVRLPGPVERAVFQLLARVTAGATGPVDIAVVAGDHEVTVTVKGAAAPDVVAADRLAVLGGTLHTTPSTGAATTLRATLPLPPRQRTGSEGGM